MTPGPHDGFEIDEISDGDVEAVVALWRSCDLTRPWNDPHRDIVDARSTPTATILVARPAVGSERAVEPERGADEAGGSAGVSGADEGAVPVGSVMAGFDGHRGWLYYLAVDASVRGTGIGRRLVVAAEAWLAAQGAGKVQLMVRETNAGVQGFYTALGYTDAECVVLGRRLP